MISEQDKQIIEDSLWIVDTVLKKQNIKSEDIRQSAILYLLKVYERFDANFGVKWSTYAYKNIYLYVKRKNAKELFQDSKMISFDAVYLTVQKEDRILSKLTQQELCKRLLMECSEIEKKILILYMNKYNFIEISSRLKMRVGTVKSIFQGIIEKFKDSELCREYLNG